MHEIKQTVESSFHGYIGKMDHESFLLKVSFMVIIKHCSPANLIMTK